LRLLLFAEEEALAFVPREAACAVAVEGARPVERLAAAQELVRPCAGRLAFRLIVCCAAGGRLGSARIGFRPIGFRTIIRLCCGRTVGSGRLGCGRWTIWLRRFASGLLGCAAGGRFGSGRFVVPQADRFGSGRRWLIRFGTIVRLVPLRHVPDGCWLDSVRPIVRLCRVRLSRTVVGLIRFGPIVRLCRVRLSRTVVGLIRFGTIVRLRRVRLTRTVVGLIRFGTIVWFGGVRLIPDGCSADSVPADCSAVRRSAVPDGWCGGDSLGPIVWFVRRLAVRAGWAGSPPDDWCCVAEPRSVVPDDLLG